jgi:hypothetical protein
VLQQRDINATENITIKAQHGYQLPIFGGSISYARKVSAENKTTLVIAQTGKLYATSYFAITPAPDITMKAHDRINIFGEGGHLTGKGTVTRINVNGQDYYTVGTTFRMTPIGGNTGAGLIPTKISVSNGTYTVTPDEASLLRQIP